MARRVFISRVDQGLPLTIEDPAALDRVAAVFRLVDLPEPPPSSPSSPGTRRRGSAAGSEG